MGALLTDLILLRIAAGAISLLVLIVVMLLLRPAILWYWQINRAVKALERIANSLELMPAVQEYRKAQQPTSIITPARAGGGSRTRP